MYTMCRSHCARVRAQQLGGLRMTFRTKLIFGFAIATIGAACAAGSGILPLQMTWEKMRASRDPEVRMAAQSLQNEMKPALIAAATGVGLAMLTGIVVTGMIVPRLRRFADDADAIASGMLKGQMS